ncbi:MAG: hypothetical protein JXX14_05585 [Deltaproteobacteria bacterium]|nr:hypothetical protein [Deltaproteobacteria bacterium]
MKRLFAVLVVSVALSTPSFAARKAILANVSNYGDAPRCSGSDLSYGESAQNYLASKLTSWGYDYIGKPDNMGVEFHEWADKDKDSKGRDHESPYGVDSADVAMYYGHGSRSCSSDTSTIYMGLNVTGEECGLSYGRDGGEVHWGDTDLNVVLLEACQTVHKCVFDGGGYNSGMRSGNMSLMLGYHGISYEGYWPIKHFENFVDETKTEDLGSEWVDEMTDLMWGDDECATAVAWGSDSSQTSTIYHHSGWIDWFTPGYGTMTFFYWDGCDPDDGEEL